MRRRAPNSQVEEYIQALPPAKRELAREVRRIVVASAPHLQEAVRWESACFFFHGPVCYFAPSRGGIHLGFFRGKELDDPGRRLVSRRGPHPYIIVRSLRDIDEAYFSDLVRQAVRLNRG